MYAHKAFAAHIMILAVWVNDYIDEYSSLMTVLMPKYIAS